MPGVTTITGDTKPRCRHIPTLQDGPRELPLPPPSRHRRAGWFANRPLAVKFGILLGVVVLAFGGVLGSVLIGNAAVREASDELAHLNHAEELVLQLDTRASELKVDGFKALVREDPAEQLAELADDIATPEAMLAELDTVHLADSPPSAAAVADAAGELRRLHRRHHRLRRRRGRRPGGTRVRWEEIQAANDLTDGAVGAAKDALAAASAEAQVTLDEAIQTAQMISLDRRPGRPASWSRASAW